ncbi:uncharacterized protein BJ171DRAFT_499090 [Polychytrium aggregatum]|uniref:uncharacterized protein n=1 Tax=Polychytrium aggregatum TaxID=110093 RepID=UPI0022FDC1C8|nr:uncharacterized protein BJ171DRAFT_499090 [Polychytrium aggregatum]KAI9206202.1 hypothetical protein BJ171DRAFT_499090 [Polychytrium aggregatum]
MAAEQDYTKERSVAIEAVIKASQLCESVFRELVNADTIVKKDKSPVTIADFGAQAVVNSILQAHFPNDRIVGEEDSKDLKANPDTCQKVLELANSVMEIKFQSQSELCESIDRGNFAGGPGSRFWTLDPIDGTKGFLRGEQFAVCLALIVDGKVRVGVMGCPNLPRRLQESDGPRGTLMIAVEGQGAFQRTFDDDSEKKIEVTKTSSASKIQFCESVESGHTKHDDNARIAEILQISEKSIRMDSQCKYAVVARGEAGIYLRLPTSATYEEKIWDHASGALLIEEAGGHISDVLGNPLDFSQGRTLKMNKGIIATCAFDGEPSGEIHTQVLSAVKAVLNL